MSESTVTRSTRATAPWWTGALSGVLAAVAGVAVGSGVATLLGVPTPIESVGNRVIDLVPRPLKEFAIEQFGTNDKPVLIGGVAATLLVAAAVAGWLGLRRPRLAVGITAVLGLVALVTAVLDRTSTANVLVTALPSLVTLVLSVFLLMRFLTALEMAPKVGDETPKGFDRRAFLQVVLAASAAMAIGGGVTRFLGSSAGSESRAAVNLPKAAVPAAAVPAGAQVELTGISPYLTPNKDFYRIDTALRVPQVAADTFNLRIHGMVDQELNLSFEDLLKERLVERRITLTCVSNEVGGPYVGNAQWLGVPIAELLARAGVQDGADAVKSTSADDMTIGTPLEALTDDRGSLIAVGMNGEPLPLEHGFPVRMVVPGLYGYVSATKWLVDLEVTRFADFKAYWSTRGYSEEAPIKLSSRIDVPKAFEALPRDNVRIGGVAWAQTTGIERVEVKIDDGDWQDVELAEQDTVDTWRQWSWTWEDATEGTHQVTVRATDADGTTQTSDRVPIAPDGSTGWHNVRFRVE